MAAYLVALERHDEARSRAREAVAMSRSVHYEVALVWALQHLAAVAAFRPSDDAAGRREDRKRAARLLAYADARLATLEALREYTEEEEYLKMRATLREAFSEDELSAMDEEGRALSEERAVAEAMLV
jgi:hypothetical protein